MAFSWKQIDRLIRARPLLSGFALIFAVHLGVALLLKWVGGVDIQSDPGKNTWEFFWQTIPMQDLHERFWSSLWNFHAQPPLYNVYGYVLNVVFAARFLQAMQYVNLLLGAAMCGLMQPLLVHLTGRPRLSLVAALVFSLNPSIFLYEAFILYTLPVAFMIMLSVWLMLLFQERRAPLFFYLALAVLNVVILTRSLYHLALAVPVIVLGILAVECRRLRLVWISLAITLAAAGWYTKNYAKFGVFASSSWMGSNLWRMVSQNYTPEELHAFAREGLLDPAAVERRYFDRPSKFIPYGFDKTSDLPVLSRDDYNNINMIDISLMHLRNARRLIRRDPAHYGRNVIKAYGRFCMPSYETQFVAFNVRRIPRAIAASSFLHGEPFFRRLNTAWGTGFTSFYQFLIPAILLLFLARAARAGRFSPGRWAGFIRENTVSCFLAILIAFVTMVASLFEYGENCRFKFPVELLILCFTVAMIFPRRPVPPAPAP